MLYNVNGLLDGDGVHEMLILNLRGRFDEMLTNDDRTGRWIQKYENFAEVILESSHTDAESQNCVASGSNFFSSTKLYIYMLLDIRYKKKNF